MQEAVTEAVQAAVDEGMNFDLRANLYTLVAITGVFVPPLLRFYTRSQHANIL